MMLNCLIIDDEPLARQQLESYINRVPYLALAGSVRNPVVGKTILDNEAVDLVFLDIKMPQMTGIDFLREYHISQQVILVTAYPEYALDGFELEVTDYLMKPVTFERFLKAVEKAKAQVGGTDTIKRIKLQPDFLYVKNNQRYEKMALDDIIYIESMLNYVNIVTAKKKYTIYSSLKNAEACLPKERFLRIHKSYIVAVAKIDAIDAGQVHAGGHKLPLSRANKNEIIRAVLDSGLSLTNIKEE